MQLAEHGLAGHAAAREYARPTQAAACFVHVQFHTAFMALGDSHNHDAVFLRPLQAGEKVRVVTGAGAAAEALQYQGLDPAVEQGVELGRANARHQRQHTHAGLMFGVAVGQFGRERSRPGSAAVACQCHKWVSAKAAHFGAACGCHQLAVKVQLHAMRLALAQRLQGTTDVFPGIAVRYARWQHGAGKQHRRRQAQQLKAHGRSAVGQRVSAMQDQDAIAAILVHGFDDRGPQAQPVGRGHVGAVDQRAHFAKGPLWYL